MRTANWITFYAGVLIGLAYLAGSLVRTWVQRKVKPESPGWIAPLAEAVVTLAAATAAQLVIEATAPGSSGFRNFSAVGFLSPKALTVWEAVALWAGLAAVIGAVAPFSSRFRGGSSGIAGAAVLVVRFVPGLLPIAAGAWITGIAAFKSVRTTLPLVFGSVVVAEWVLSFTRLQSPWGVVHGPEPTLWLAGMACVLIARWSHGYVGLGTGTKEIRDERDSGDV